MTLSRVQRAERREERLKRRAFRLKHLADGARVEYEYAVRERRELQREHYLHMRVTGTLTVAATEEDVDEFFD